MNILIAEDEKDIRELLIMHLEQTGYNVIASKNGLEALELFKNHLVDLCIFDIMMPYMNGFDLVSIIRESSTVPIILLTAKGDELDKVEGFKRGADDYLVKPFGMAELIARVGAGLRRSNEYAKHEEDSIIKINDLELNTLSCEVNKNRKGIDLNTKEYLLLKLFMENPNRVFTKKQLYNAVWKEEYLYDENTVMVHISRLRNKLESIDVANCIKTIKGIGYKFIGERKS